MSFWKEHLEILRFTEGRTGRNYKNSKYDGWYCKFPSGWRIFTNKKWIAVKDAVIQEKLKTESEKKFRGKPPSWDGFTSVCVHLFTWRVNGFFIMSIRNQRKVPVVPVRNFSVRKVSVRKVQFPVRKVPMRKMNKNILLLMKFVSIHCCCVGNIVFFSLLLSWFLVMRVIIKICMENLILVGSFRLV